MWVKKERNGGVLTTFFLLLLHDRAVPGCWAESPRSSKEFTPGPQPQFLVIAIFVIQFSSVQSLSHV